MLKAAYEDILEDCPRYVPVFRIARLPKWANLSPVGYTSEPYYVAHMKVGAEVYTPQTGYDGVQFWDIGHGRYHVGTIGIGPSYLEFVEFRKVEERG